MQTRAALPKIGMSRSVHNAMLALLIILCHNHQALAVQIKYLMQTHPNETDASFAPDQKIRSIELDAACVICGFVLNTWIALSQLV